MPYLHFYHYTNITRSTVMDPSTIMNPGKAALPQTGCMVHVMLRIPGRIAGRKPVLRRNIVFTKKG